ncbi:hypothetical protein [Ekhidna sp.]|uniref:hypothetical protein n=1 Tax=Ekhidna sp. TaxID=2608089 RepID=UPI003519313F
MKEYLLILLFLSSLRSFSQDFSVNGELEYVNQILIELKEDSAQSWYPNERNFFEHWRNGLNEELSSNYQKAIQYFEMAINQDRGELPTYYPLFSMGRTSQKLGNDAFSKECFRRFLEHANSELNFESSWAPTKEHKNRLSLQISELQDK